MAEVLRNSPVSVTITRPRSPTHGRCTRGHECLRSQARTKSAERRNSLYLRSNYLGTDLCSSSPSYNYYRSKSSDSTSRSSFLDVPSKTVILVPNRISRKRSPTRKDHANINQKETRSRSASPFDWIERERLPRGSQTFEQVMCEMLSDTEIYPKSSYTDTNQELVKQKTCNGYAKV